jgi:glycosyltransferase involved in cell wall biosynthesis
MTKPIGINVIGHISGNLGLGVAARNIIGSMISRGIQVRLLNIDPGHQRNDFDKSYNSLFSSTLGELIFPINIFILSPLSFTQDFIHLFSDKTNVAYSYWELPHLPEVLKTNLRRMDIVVAPSTFIYETYGRELDNTFLIKGKTPYSFDFKEVPLNTIKNDTFKIFSAFEPNSDIERKNPFLIVDCFQKAFIDIENVELVVKINNAYINDTNNLHSSVIDLISYCKDDSRINFDFESYSHLDLMNYFKNFNIAISLHRAEGFGLMPLEMMALGVPVISTNWSGNTDYMNSENSFLVRHRMIDANGSIEAYKSDNYKNGTQWADPNLDDAIHFMRYAFSNDLTKISKKAKESAIEYIKNANQVKFVDELISIHKLNLLCKKHSL